MTVTPATARATARSKSRPASVFRCAECGWTTGKWVGRCGECQAWASIVETGAGPARSVAAGPVTAPARPIAEIDADSATHRPTGVAELDRVLGGGLVPGSVVLLAGEPGVGKSTLLLDVAARFADGAGRALYVSGEESAAQVSARAGRIGAVADRLFLAAESDLGAVLGQVEQVDPALLVLDSIQTIGMPDADTTSGGVAQVREVTAALVRAAKARSMAVLLVGHVTKDGGIAGPRTLEHLVDVVLQFEGDRQTRLRLVRGLKNRYGPADEVGCFDLTDGGIVGLADPSGLFLSGRDAAVPGTCATVTVEGRRPLVAEVQALVAASPLPTPRRATTGLDASRTALVLAVLERRCGVRLAAQDVFAATVGGLRLTEPAADLALALAVAGAARDLSVPAGTVAIGEVGLTGELRPVTALDRRLAEAARLGFTQAVIPAAALRSDRPPRAAGGLRLVAAGDVRDALRRLS